MSQAGANSSSGGGGGGTASALQPDVGAPVSAVAGNIPTFGQDASTVQTIRTYNDGAGNFRIADQTWETQYVIDASSTVGLKGTFTTIQAALDQAVIDGMTISNQRKFYIRPGSYTENLSIPAGALFESAGYRTNPSLIPPFVTITGSHILSDICEFGTNGIQWVATGAGHLFTTGATICVFLSRNSIFSTTTGQILNALTGNTNLTLYDSQFISSATPFSTVFTVATMGSCDIKDCLFNGYGFQVNSGTLRIQSCIDLGEINLNGGGLVATQCNFRAASNPNIYGTGTASVINCGFSNNTSSNYAIACIGGVELTECYMIDEASLPRALIDPSVTYSQGFTQTGNVLLGIRTATNYVEASNGVNYIGVTNTSSARSIQIRRGLGSAIPMPDYQVFVADESGGASTHNITVTDVDGALIDGQASYVISQNYGSALFHCDGTNWIVISTANQSIQFPLLSPISGSSGNPAYSFLAAPSTGMFASGSNLVFSSNGNANLVVGFNNVYAGNTNQFINGIVFGGITNTSTSITIPFNTYSVFVDTVSAVAGVTLTLQASPIPGEQFVIKDSTGSASTKNITISGNGNTIDGAATLVMNINYQSTTLIYNGSQWSAI